MAMEYLGLDEINGPLVALDGVEGAGYEEMVRLRTADGERLGRVIALEGSRAVVQVFSGTSGLSLDGVSMRFSGKPMELALAPEIVGRIFNGAGEPIDGLGSVYPEKFADVNGSAINPVSRAYPRNYIRTGISSIDTLITLIRGQKLPIFSGSGMSHNRLAAQIVRQARISEEEGANFGIVFCAMGVTKDVADYFRRSFEESGALNRVTMFVNLSSDPIIERILTPRCALTAADRSDNLVIYGHNMKTGTIFGFLTDYKQPETYQEHPTIRLDTLYGAGEYEVFAAFAIDIAADRSFAYNNYIDLDEDSFREFVEEVKRRSDVDSGITPVYGDELLTLSTCEYSSANGRYVVCARRTGG